MNTKSSIWLDFLYPSVFLNDAPKIHDLHNPVPNTVPKMFSFLFIHSISDHYDTSPGSKIIEVCYFWYYYETQLSRMGILFSDFPLFEYFLPKFPASVFQHSLSNTCPHQPPIINLITFYWPSS